MRLRKLAEAGSLIQASWHRNNLNSLCNSGDSVNHCDANSSSLRFRFFEEGKISGMFRGATDRRLY
jgi:hypothetical protein